jgi:hypothetical protein
MSITSVQKTSLLVGILAIVGAGAFVYFDPLNLDLLGLKQKPAVSHPSAPAHVVAPTVKPPVAALKPAVTPTEAKTIVAKPTPSPATGITSTVAVPKAEIAPPQVKAPAAATPSATPKSVSAAPASAATPLEMPTAQAPQQPMKLSKETETVKKPVVDKPARPKNLDLRYCLDLETNEAIAKCAGE